ncbi:hypothetical protein A3216_02250 [Mycobacterium leprae 7935681]|nr:SDR family NAD(P)-dependent oxidoreductase [Mycobacterium leprae]OAX72029.1 hypothetical protein A3216_02250 [Mycobacterium leprae 7935681]
MDQLAGSLSDVAHEEVVCDLISEGAVFELLEQVGDIDVLVPNAGFPKSGLLEGSKHDEINRTFRVNLEASVRMTRDLLLG